MSDPSDGRPVSVGGPLVVPVHLDALCLANDIDVKGPANDSTPSPYSDAATALVRDLAQNGNPLPLDDSGNAAADSLLRRGHVPVRPTLRQGGSTLSWYRGPVTTGPVAVSPLPATRSSDRPLRLHPDIGMFKAGYAAAWELGRLLDLQSADYATALYDLRRRRSQKRLRATLEAGLSARRPRSGVVSGYPALVVEAFTEGHDSPLEEVGTTCLTPLPLRRHTDPARRPTAPRGGPLRGGTPCRRTVRQVTAQCRKDQRPGSGAAAPGAGWPAVHRRSHQEHRPDVGPRDTPLRRFRAADDQDGRASELSELLTDSAAAPPSLRLASPVAPPPEPS